MHNHLASSSSLQQPICAVVITYNPCTDTLHSLLQTLQHNHTPFVLVDNHSSNINSFKAQVGQFVQCLKFQCNISNIGHAAAINQALCIVKDLGFECALLFDQDSAISADFVKQMHEAWLAAQHLAPGRVAAIGPRLVDPRNHKLMPFRLFDRLFERREALVLQSPTLFETSFLITSGTLLSLQAFYYTGPMREDYFIDNVDLEWCFRARHCGYRLLGTSHAIMHHHIGEAGSSFWVRQGFVVQHNAQRYYYSTRNRLHLHKQTYAPWVWRVKDWIRFCFKTLYLLTSSPARAQYFKQLKNALRDSKHLA